MRLLTAYLLSHYEVNFRIRKKKRALLNMIRQIKSIRKIHIYYKIIEINTTTFKRRHIIKTKFSYY